MTKRDCLGCNDDFYNGKNPLGVTECWRFKTAALTMRKAVHVDQRPPWNQPAELRPSCYSKRRYVFVKPETTR